MKYVNSIVSAVSLLLLASDPVSPANAAEPSNTRQRLTVVSMIERPYIYRSGLGSRHHPLSPSIGSFSPSRARFIVATLSPDVSKRTVRQKLHLFNADGLRFGSAEALNSSRDGEIIFQADVDQERNLIRSLVWHGENEISFLAPGSNGKMQVFRGRLSGDGFKQITNASSDIYQYAFNGDELIFMARVHSVEGRFTARVASSDSITTLGGIFDGGPSAGPRMPVVELFRQDLESDRIERIEVPPMLMKDRYMQMFPSPSGRYLVLRYPSVNHPRHWSGYGGYRRFDLSYSTEYNEDERSSDASSTLLQNRHRWMLIDLVSGEFRPLMDAPAAHGSGTGGHGTVHWTRDSSSVVITYTALPLTGVATAEAERRRTSLAAVAVEIRSGKLTPLAYFGPNADPDPRLVTWLPDKDAIVIPRNLEDGTTAFEAFHFADSWKPSRVDNPSRESFELYIQEGLNTRPKLYARSKFGRGDALVLDPDIEADRLSFAATEIFNWSDSNGLTWTGGLIRPVGFNSGQRYPLIVQTHGFERDRPLLTGPFDANASFAAQAFANAGFLVLQVEDKREIPNGSAKGYGEGYRAAIEALVEAGLADPDRIGIIGWSSTGSGTSYLLSTYPNIVSAATFADSLIGEPFMGLMNLGLDKPFPAYGPTFKDIPMAEWWERNMLSRIQRTRAAVRLEAYSPDSAIAMWEAYALLKGYRRPAEFVYLPGAEHSPFNPGHRLISQGGTVDWMRFWLQGYEDPDLTKQEQYRRWRKLREASSTQGPQRD